MSNLFSTHEVKPMWIHRTNLGRCGPGGGCVHCRDKTYLQDISGQVVKHLPWLVNLASLLCGID